MRNKNYFISDPIHNFIRVNDSEIKIIDNPIFQRLRRIRQLSGAHLAYPGAQHSRFEHSLGVLHIAGQAGLALQEKGVLDYDKIKDLRMAGLLHDIGHGPFSHLFEEILHEKKKISHEEIGKNLILKTAIGDTLSKNSYNKKYISDLAFGNSKLQFMNEIISGALSADMMDYLLRDGYFTGAEHAKIDHDRIIQSLEVHQKKLALEKSALYSFESMMHSRYQMFKAVYFHKTVRAAEVMIIESMRLADDELGLTSLDLSDFVELTDDVLLSKLINLPEYSDELKRAKKYALDYQNRKLFKCVFERILKGKSNANISYMNKIKKSLSKKSKITENEIFVDTSVAPSMPLSPSKKESQSVILISKDSKKIKAETIPISKIPLVSTMSGFMNIIRVYTLQKNRKKVEIAAHSILGELK